jgi:iron complex transport system substrate-binding protein
MKPDVIVGFWLNKAIPLDILQKSGLKVMFNGDWQNNPTWKAEWIKFLAHCMD